MARMVSVSASWGIFSQLWNYLPINMLKVDEGFCDLRLVHLFGTKLTTWQFAPHFIFDFDWYYGLGRK